MESSAEQPSWLRLPHLGIGASPSNLFLSTYLSWIGSRGEGQDDPVGPDHLFAQLLLQVVDHLLLDGRQLVRQPGCALERELDSWSLQEEQLKTANKGEVRNSRGENKTRSPFNSNVPDPSGDPNKGDLVKI